LTGGCAITSHIRINGTSPSFLIVCFRYIGDVLVTTPLALSIKTAFPDAAIDYLVFQGTDKAIAKNPLIRNIITLPKNKSNLGALLAMFRRYDLALGAYPSDRAVVAAAVAGKRSIGLVYGSRRGRWKRVALDMAVECDDRQHVVTAMLSLAEAIGISPVPRAVMGYDEADLAFAKQAISAERYLLLHPYSLKSCKYWPAENWGKLAALIHDKTGCQAVFTATPAADDNRYLAEILRHAPSDVATFACSLTQFAAALKGCTAYVGIDTATTHIAAAMEIPTVCLYGPSLTRYWAPWPNGCEDKSPFVANKGVQRRGYVTVIQKEWDCSPCNRETCAISTRDRMECLEAIAPEEVLKEIIRQINM
jgi:heptosyltransferase-3